MLSTLFPINFILVIGSFKMQWLEENDIWKPLSHNWLILSRLCLSPSTYKTFSMQISLELPILPVPSIFPLLLSPYETCPLLFALKEMNFDQSPVICLEQPLSRYHNSLLAFQHTYKTKLVSGLRYPNCFGSWRVSRKKQLPFLSIQNHQKAHHTF